MRTALTAELKERNVWRTIYVLSAAKNGDTAILHEPSVHVIGNPEKT